MNRNASYPALILRSRPSGESNREVWLLAAGTGLIRATVFGGPKSKLRAYASPFHSGRAWVYHDPAKDARKLSDFDVRTWRPGLRELYERAMAADAVAETILVSYGGGGNWGGALLLAEAVLDALDSADSETCTRLLLAFLWQWTGFLGLRPDIDYCSICGKPAPIDGTLLFLPREGATVCPVCRGGQSGGAVMAGPGCRRWLETVGGLSPADSVRYTLDGQSLYETKTFVTTVLAEALGRRPASWEW